MSQWKETLSKVGGYFVFGLLSILLIYMVVQGLVEKLDSRWYSLAGLLILVGLSVLLWKKIHLWSRVHLLGTYLIVLIGFFALFFSTEAKTAFKIGPLNLSFLVNLLIFLSLSLSLFFLLRGLKLSRNIKIVIGVVGGICSIPFLIGLIRDIPLPDVLRGAGFLGFIPWFLQPALFGVVILLPILLIFLVIDFFRALKAETRSTLRSGFNLLIALIPLVIGWTVVLGQTQKGIVTRYFADHTFGSFKDQKIETEPLLDWKTPPVKPEEGNRFWVEWEGMLQVPKDGEYEFRIQGDGNGFLYLDGRRVFGGNRKKGEIKLKSGRKKFRAAAIEDKKEGKFQVQWRRKGEKEFKDIDPKALSYVGDQTKWRRTPRQAAQVGVDWLQSASVDWQNHHKCYGCHVQAQVLMGLSVAEKNDYEVNRQYFDILYDYMKEKQNKNGSYYNAHHLTSTQFAVMGLAYAQWADPSRKNKKFTKSMDWLLEKQREDGEFRIDHNEAPIDQGSIMTSANSAYALMQAYKETGEKKYKKAAERALKWIEGAEAKTTQDKVYKILAFTQYGTPSQARIASEVVEQLKSEQQPDGGWREVDSLKGSNGYATGQVLYAFKKGAVSVNSPEFSKGVRFLLDNQKVSGAWPAVNTQTHRPSEFAPTMWAVIGLAGSFGEIIPEILEPKDKSSVEGKLTIKAQVTNFTDSKIKSVKFELDGKKLGDGKKEKENFFTLPWDTTGLKEGEHTLKVIAINKAGKTGESQVVVFFGLGVKVKIVSPADGSKVSLKQVITAEAIGLFGQKIEKVEFFVNPVGKPTEKSKIGEQREEGEKNFFGIEWDTTSLAEGKYKITAVATNTRGQQAQDSIIVLKQKPLSVRITQPTSGQTVSGLVVCTAEVINNTDDPTDFVEFFLDSENSMGRSLSEKLEVPCNFENAALGPHSLKVVAVTKGGMTAEDGINLTVGETKGPGYLKVQLKNLDEPSGEQVLYFPPDHIELVLDMSNSMWGQIQGVAKVEIAREVLGNLLKGFPKDASLGLRIYGHRSKSDCKDTELLIPFGKFDPEAIMSKVKPLKPKGMTPIDYSLREVLKDLQGLEGSRVVILVTDGIESCQGNPALAAEALMAAGLKLKIHVVGFDIAGDPEAVKQLEKISKVGKGKFFLAQDAEGLNDALTEAVKVTYSVYDDTGKLIFTKPLSLESNELMSGNYRVEVALDPPLVLDSVKIEKGKTSMVDVLKEKKAFRIESPNRGPPTGKTPETRPAETQPTETQPTETQPAETLPETAPSEG